MTLDSMQWHEAVTLRHAGADYRRQGLLRLVRPHVRGTRVLDLRCLEGELAVELAAEGLEVTALDGFEEAVRLTNERARRRGIQRPIAQAWALRDLVRHVGGQRFDTVVCADVLNHVRDDDATVAEISQVLAERGRLILVVPAFPWLLGKRDQTLGHLRRYTRPGLTALLARHGLRVDTLRYWNFTAFPLYLLIERLLRRRISDGLRYAGSRGRPDDLANRVLGWWYRTVERRLSLPFGLSIFAVAHPVARS